MSASRKALIVWGGWDGHEPERAAELFKEILEGESFEVDMSDSLASFEDDSHLNSLDLIVPVWTMGKISAEQVNPVLRAVESGVGIAGCHGGMCDSFRGSTDWQFMTGGQWVAHPGNDGVAYTVEFNEPRSELTEGFETWHIESEQYYLHVDPAVKVHAFTRFPVADGPHVPNGEFDMPVVWTKRWGAGRVFYNSLGHQRSVLEPAPIRELMRRGFLWAANGRIAAP